MEFHKPNQKISSNTFYGGTTCTCSSIHSPTLLEGFLITSPIPPPALTPSLNTVIIHIMSVSQLCSSLSCLSHIPSLEHDSSIEKHILIGTCITCIHVPRYNLNYTCVLEQAHSIKHFILNM